MSNPFDQFGTDLAPQPHPAPPMMSSFQSPQTESAPPTYEAGSYYGQDSSSYGYSYLPYNSPPPSSQPPSATPNAADPFAAYGGAAIIAPEQPPPQPPNPSYPYVGGVEPTSQAAVVDPWGATPTMTQPPATSMPPAAHGQEMQGHPQSSSSFYGQPPGDAYGGQPQTQSSMPQPAPTTFGNPPAVPPPPPPQDGYGHSTAPLATPFGQEMYGQPPPSPAADPNVGYAQPPFYDQQQQQFPPTTDPNTASVYGQQPPQQQFPPTADPNTASMYGQQPPQQQPMYGDSSLALVPSQQQSNPYATATPFGAYGMAPPPDPNALMPSAHQYNQYATSQPPPFGGPPSYGYAPPPPPPIDPFSVFESKQPAQPSFPEQQPGFVTDSAAETSGPDPTASDDDFWGSFGNNNAAAVAPIAKPPNATSTEPKTDDDKKQKEGEEKKGDEGLPPGGEWYDARIFTPTLGVMFFKPQELTDSLFLNTDKEIVDALGDRPVVAFIVEGSSARSAGVELGHVLLKVNGVDVKNPKDASRLIKEGPRPLPLLFYVPNTEVVIAEGEHMVKYDTKETTAPNSAKDWKPKYVVIGGIIAQPWMMNMYRSKSEYDIAVIETQARRPVSVKVKQFSLQGARIQNDWQGPQMVKYKNKLHPWKFIVVLPVARNPIKIASPNLSQLKPVHEGIRRVLLAQQRGRGGGSNRQAARDDFNRSSSGNGYENRGSDNRGGYDQSQYRY